MSSDHVQYQILPQSRTKGWYSRWWGRVLILFFFLFLSLFLAIAMYIYELARQISVEGPLPADIPAVELSAEDKARIEGDARYWFGSPNPAVTIVEFGDFACSFCREQSKTIREISLVYKDKVKYIFRHLPITTQGSADLALAAECAGRQGHFWHMHDKLFLDNVAADQASIYQAARQIGIDQAMFKKCFEDPNTKLEIEKSVRDGLLLGVQGTPTWYINGHKIAGYIPHDDFMRLVENLINKN
jgi:protein-disulfide isomerase